MCFWGKASKCYPMQVEGLPLLSDHRWMETYFCAPEHQGPTIQRRETPGNTVMSVPPISLLRACPEHTLLGRRKKKSSFMPHMFLNMSCLIKLYKSSHFH